MLLNTLVVGPVGRFGGRGGLVEEDLEGVVVEGEGFGDRAGVANEDLMGGGTVVALVEVGEVVRKGVVRGWVVEV